MTAPDHESDAKSGALPQPPLDTDGLPALLRHELRAAFTGLDMPGAVAAVVTTAALIISHHHGGTGAFRRYFPELAYGQGLPQVAPYLFWFAASVLLYLVLPAIASTFTPGVRETGLGLGHWRAGLAATGMVLLVFLPVVFAASRLPAFAGHYPLCAAAKQTWTLFVVYELGYAAYFVAWEYLFRGYLLFSLEPSMGKMAVFAQAIPFAIIHFGKPEAETFGAIAAGIVLGMLALRTRSCWYGAIIHIGVALTMDVLTAWDSLGA